MISKPEARKEAAQLRAKAHAKAHAEGLGDAITAALRAALSPYHDKIIAAYMPIRSEVDPWPALADHQGPLALPVVIAKAAPLGFRLWDQKTPLAEGDYGALIPPKGDFIAPDVLIVPLLAFDRQGYRLGYGGGYYDRSLALLRAERPVIALGLAYSAQEREHVPREPTDAPLDGIVTEKGLRWFNAGALPD